ncbi:MAG: hypothetical protein OXB93_03725, partial [Cytophagales bacterium]|nr:hypothetical protein [Cytophagales bacterium]
RNEKDTSVNQCRTSFSIKVGTIFEKSKLSLSVWLAGFYIILTSRKGGSSVQLSKELGVTQKTSWFLQHRIREACTEDTEHLLKGAIEANKHMINRTDGTQGRSTKTKVAVVCLKELEGVGVRPKRWVL